MRTTREKILRHYESRLRYAMSMAAGWTPAIEAHVAKLKAKRDADLLALALALVPALPLPRLVKKAGKS